MSTFLERFYCTFSYHCFTLYQSLGQLASRFESCWIDIRGITSMLHWIIHHHQKFRHYNCNWQNIPFETVFLYYFVCDYMCHLKICMFENNHKKYHFVFFFIIIVFLLRSRHTFAKNWNVMFCVASELTELGVTGDQSPHLVITRKIFCLFFCIFWLFSQIEHLNSPFLSKIYVNVLKSVNFHWIYVPWNRKVVFKKLKSNYNWTKLKLLKQGFVYVKFNVGLTIKFVFSFSSFFDLTYFFP